MGQNRRTIKRDVVILNSNVPVSTAAQVSAAERVYRGVMRELENGRLVPGQRLAEPDLAERFNVGRNAVREAMQRLALRGVVEMSAHRSASIRLLDLDEAMQVLDVARVLTALLAETAAKNFEVARHGGLLEAVLSELEAQVRSFVPGGFSRARRRFYRTLLQIGGNRELQRLFPAVGMHIIYSQMQSPVLGDVRLTDYRAISRAVRRKDAAAAHKAGSEHVEHVRSIMLAEQALPVADGSRSKVRHI